MAGQLARLIDRWRLRKVQEYWTRTAEAAPTLRPLALHSLRGQARAMRRHIDRVIHVADHKLATPAIGAGLPRLPLGTDWSWRADAWRGPLPQPGLIATTDRSRISDDLSLYHDCPLGEVAVRQSRNSGDDDRAPFGLCLEVFGFQGSFLSLATSLPAEAVQGLKSRHLLRLDAIIHSERPLRAYARLNVRHGPNVAQIVRELPALAGEVVVDFDLAYAKLDDTRIERAWLDLIFNDTAMNGIALRDLVVSRRPRAKL
jgi:Family of unknown function (DUF6478)